VSIESLYLNPRDWADSREIDYRRGLAVTAIDRVDREVFLADGERVPYDRLVIATGAHRSFRPSTVSAPKAASCCEQSTTPFSCSSTFGDVAVVRP
jgi:NAD(P)H-nitrite reductase large subunit